MRDDEDYSDEGTSPVLAFLLGAATGAVLALLYAPRSGQETRELLNEKLRETAERGREAREQLVTRGARAAGRRGQLRREAEGGGRGAQGALRRGRRGGPAGLP